MYLKLLLAAGGMALIASRWRTLTHCNHVVKCTHVMWHQSTILMPVLVLKKWKTCHTVKYRILGVVCKTLNRENCNLTTKSKSNHAFAVYLFAGEPHEHVSHDALPLAFEHTFLESVEELEVLLDQEPQRAGKWTEGREKRKREREQSLPVSLLLPQGKKHSRGCKVCQFYSILQVGEHSYLPIKTPGCAVRQGYNNQSWLWMSYMVALSCDILNCLTVTVLSFVTGIWQKAHLIRLKPMQSFTNPIKHRFGICTFSLVRLVIGNTCAEAEAVITLASCVESF